MNIPSDIQEQVAKATFKVRSKKVGNGQCVLIEDDLFITAAHCVEWNCNSMMTIGEFYLSNIETGDGVVLASALAVEPVSDIAVLGCPDYQTFEHAPAAFDALCERTTPVKLLRNIPKAFVPFPVWIWTHTMTWVAGMATYHGAGATFAYKTPCEIPSGTSGGPIVNHSGELVGVVSNGTNASSQGEYNSTAGFLPSALPAWIISRVARA